jgi:DNA-binding response OmpR family regulator
MNPPPRRTPLIVLAEDDAAMRDLLAASLRRAGYQVFDVADGHALEARLFTDTDRGDDLPDLVISDVMMPGTTGLNALCSVRDRAWATPWVLITAFGGDGLHREAKDLGACVLDKPFALAELHRIVRLALSP